MATITSANSIFMLAIAGLYPVPQQLQGYAADDAFSSDDLTPTEAVMGVDGHLSAGYTPVPVVQTISIQADSPSLALFEQWQAAMKAAVEVYFASATITLPAIGKKYTFTRGTLTRAKKLPDAKKTLQPISFQITWESVTEAAF